MLEMDITSNLTKHFSKVDKGRMTGIRADEDMFIEDNRLIGRGSSEKVKEGILVKSYIVLSLFCNWLHYILGL